MGSRRASSVALRPHLRGQGAVLHIARSAVQLRRGSGVGGGVGAGVGGGVALQSRGAIACAPRSAVTAAVSSAALCAMIYSLASAALP